MPLNQVSDYLIAESEHHAREAAKHVADQRALVEFLDLRGDERSAEQARELLATFERTYRVAVYRLQTELMFAKMRR